MCSCSVGWVYDRRFRDHDTGEGHIECPQRLGIIVEALQKCGLLERTVPLPFRAATAEQLAWVHDPAYVELVRMACDAGFTFIGSEETRICPRSYDVAALAVGGVLAACDAVMRGHARRTFCAVRPPGHHAERDQAMGFCLFNNVAIGAEHLVRCHGLSRVAIVDIDAHHGNGIQHVFESRGDVFYISLHERPGSLDFPGTGEASETGWGPGAGYTLNVPLDRSSGERQYLEALERRVLPALDRFRPQFLLVCAGFDTLVWDRVSHLSLEPDSLARITALLVAAAERHARGRLVSVLEGGYDLAHLGPAVAAHVRSLLEAPASAGTIAEDSCRPAPGLHPNGGH